MEQALTGQSWREPLLHLPAYSPSPSRRPREDSGYRSPVDPGLALTTQIFNYVKKFYPRTRVMVSGVASRADALAVAGADFIVAPASVVEELANTPTAAGYNDGLSGAGEGVGAVERRLDAEAARRVELREDTVPVLDEATFRSMLEKSVCGEGTGACVCAAACLRRREMCAATSST